MSIPEGKAAGQEASDRGDTKPSPSSTPCWGGSLSTSESPLMTNPGDLSVLLRETPGSRQCRMVSASSTLCPPTPSRPCHPVRVASPSWSRGALPSTGAPAGGLPWLGLSLTRCMHWRICTTHQGTPPSPHIPSPPSPQCPTTYHPRQWPSRQTRGQMPLPFRTLLHGPKRTGAWCGGHTSAAELTEGCTEEPLCFSLTGVLCLTGGFWCGSHSELDFQNGPSCPSWLVDNGIYL